MKPNLKKIDIVVKYFIPVVAGIEVNILETYRVLVEQGWDVTVHTSKDVYLQKNSLPDHDSIQGLNVHRYHFSWYGFFPKINWDQSGIIALHNFDIFPHFLILLRTLFLKLLGRKKYKLVLTPHGGFNPEWSIFPAWKAFVKRTYTYSVGTWLINNTVDAVRAVSDWEKSEMIKMGLNRELVHTISNGLEDAAFVTDEKLVSPKIKQKVKSWGKYIFGDARIYSIKNLETIIEALPYIPSDIKFVNIGMVGDQNYLVEINKLAASLGVSNRVIFPGVVYGADKYHLYRHSLAFVHMAKWESFCNVVHQAIGHGLVCLVADNTALPYLVKDGINGFLIETYDYLKLAEKINYVLDPKNRQVVNTIKKHNLIHGRNNTWKNVAARMQDLYSKLLFKD
ncbi:hypothetical protein A2397_02430 [Candidatus Amesbacteria bacterium RIFOXYB1_FULL_44_23]|uniref:Glycosyl transferase family 1 domain-containing protein n=1 Tax=Candidatus Amesbacteria bacterium RIFOXYB1_FULL_44_23 TaxID=1797263 RepID=A0A1F4ZYE9_9BACT|nr:MAG: hypothetical protein A2397_02430 [Candidatus Amesbacteria bacterium RIFOXYB1_FULL_44_23]